MHVPLIAAVAVALTLLCLARPAQAQCGLLGFDTDGDGLCNSWETGCGGNTRTSATSVDSDGDFILDNIEVGQTGVPSGPAPDQDSDGIIDGCDIDSDNDTISDADESGCSAVCSSTVDSNGNQIPDYLDLDSDSDGLLDEIEAGDADVNTPPADSDSDGTPDYREIDSDNDTILDSEEGAGNQDADAFLNFQDTDSDNDGLPDSLEAGDSDLNTVPIDTDMDGIDDYLDTDSDNDGTPDAMEGVGDIDGDGIPNYRDKNDVDGPLADPDGDGLNNLDDNCDFVANGDQLDSDDDGIGDACDNDDDGDAVANTNDNCPAIFNPGQENLDGDESGDACDNDIDGDGVANGADNCPRSANADQADSDGDGIGSACDTDSDVDSDGVDDGIDVCPDIADPEQIDTDNDGAGDACDNDSDGDGLDDDQDNCPIFLNPNQEDLDEDGVGDGCDLDIDGDDTENALDNCPRIVNVDQLDTDEDMSGDACDDDDDNDMVADELDNCPLVDNADQSDVEGDGLGDACDIADHDGDGIDDKREVELGTDSFDANDFPHATGGSCSAGGSGGANLLWILAGALFWVGLRRRKDQARDFVLLTLVVIGAPGARADGIGVDTLRPSVVGRDGVVVEGSDTMLPFDFQADLFAGFATNPVELSNAAGMRLQGVVDGLSALHFRATAGLLPDVEASIQMPLLVIQGIEGIEGSGAGDMLLSGKWTVLERDQAPVGIAVWPELHLPTGDEERLMGDGSVGAGLRVGVDRRQGRWLVAANAGGRFRDGTREFEAAKVGQQFHYGALVAWTPAADNVQLSLEAVGALSINEGSAGSPGEALASVRYRRKKVALVAGGGVGLSDAFGVPDWRAFAGVSYHYNRKRDADGDGIDFAHDQCPSSPEDFDGFEDSDGCPETDNDGDGVVDTLDRCPLVAEDLDGFEDADGCAELDNDGDGIVDALDRCPNRPEDADDFEDTDGCPELDNDGDGIVDTSDKCPLEAETHNGFKDADGCADERPKFVFTRGERLSFNNILFKSQRFELLPKSYAVLDEIVVALQEQPWVRVRVEGHTDDRGRESSNLVLSQQRALAVVNYLVGGGVDLRRLEHVGYGQVRPVGPNDTEEQRAGNRRVEFLTLDDSGSAGGAPGPETSSPEKK